LRKQRIGVVVNYNSKLWIGNWSAAGNLPLQAENNESRRLAWVSSHKWLLKPASAGV
jgi:hypothetical protein